MLATLHQIGGVHFPLLGRNGFYVKVKNERFTAATPRFRQYLKYENFTSTFGRLLQKIAPKSVPHEYFSSLNQSNHWSVALSLTLPSSNLKLPNYWLLSLRFDDGKGNHDNDGDKTRSHKFAYVILKNSFARFARAFLFLNFCTFRCHFFNGL